MRIGLTGTIGSGKSLVADMLQKLGGVIIDTDIVSRKVVEPGTEGYNRLRRRWGDNIIDDDRNIDRKRLAKIVFNDEEQLRELNSILHPLIMKGVAEEMMRVDPKRVTVLVVPLLLETGFDKIVENVWVVVADPEAILQRIMKRDGMAREEAAARVAAQMPQEDKENRAHVIIRNSGSVEETRRQVEEAWKNIEKH